MAPPRRPVTRLLVANRGEIARRIFRTCAEMGIETVAVHSDADADAVFVHEADAAVGLGGTSPAESYLRIDAVVDAARRAGADAVHPGYGFLSEDARFARACIDAGLTWVGPPPDAIEAMGSKLAARELMVAAGVPVLPGADLTGVADDALADAADAVGWPVLVKASAGGGGRGMRVVRDRAQLADAVAAARREAESAFGDGTVFLEHYVEAPRHVEVQVFGDTHGSVVHLFERECSVQRRHQKIIEEAPSPRLDDEQRDLMGQAAVQAAHAVGYAGAGTVEFIVAPDGRFSFLEMNTRLQVEHPVTEAVTGLDLVRLQLVVAQGEPLPRELHAPRLAGHAVEVRLYAEDPADDYRPTPGRLDRFEVPDALGLRVDSGVRDGDVISAHYDPLLAKLVVHAPDRDEALRRLAWVLRRCRIHGVVTNRDLLVAICEHPEFRAGAVDTGFLDRHPPAALAPGPTPDARRWSAVAAALALRARSRADATVLASTPAGWRNNPAAAHERTFDTPSGPLRVGLRSGRDGGIELDGELLADVEVRTASPTAVELVIGGVRQRFATSVVSQGAGPSPSAGTAVRVDVDSTFGHVALVERSRFPSAHEALAAGSLVAPMPGTVVRVAAEVGDAVDAGQVLVVIEAMKMEHQVTAPAAGVVTEVLAEVGGTVDAGQVLAVLTEPDAAISAERGEGGP